MNPFLPPCFQPNRAGSHLFRGGAYRLLLPLLALVSWSGSAFAQVYTGTLLTTFTNPTPADYGLFGSSLAVLAGNRVLVGAEGAGAAYLFNANGTLLTTFTDPSATFTSFGASVAAIGGERVLVGAYGYNNGPAQVGRAYLFNTNGALLTTFTNPSPSTVQAFGWSVAGMDGDRVLIGTGVEGHISSEPTARF